jgi:hypothetical protein
MKKFKIKLFNYVSDFAENKDVARTLRQKAILPSLSIRRKIILDFDGVDIATQSFMHALISESVRKYGETSIDYLEFKSCSPQIKSIIKNVVGYSLEYASGSEYSKTIVIHPDDIPQADKLMNVRLVVSKLEQAKDVSDLEAMTGISKRHIYYNINAGRILGLLNPNTGEITDIGYELLKTEPGTEKERKLWINQIEESKFYQLAVPDLFEIPPPSVNAITTRITNLTGLANATSHRRATTISSWRNQIGSPQQLVLDFEFEEMD